METRLGSDNTCSKKIPTPAGKRYGLTIDINGPAREIAYTAVPYHEPTGSLRSCCHDWQWVSGAPNSPLRGFARGLNLGTFSKISNIYIWGPG